MYLHSHASSIQLTSTRSTTRFARDYGLIKTNVKISDQIPWIECEVGSIIIFHRNGGKTLTYSDSSRINDNGQRRNQGLRRNP